MARKAIPILPRDPNSKPNPSFVWSLRNGLTKLWSGRGRYIPQPAREYICHTLLDSRLREEIQRRLGSNTYRSWLQGQLPDNTFTIIQIQNGRKRWMLDLIEEFS